MAQDLKTRLHARAAALGFDAVGVASAGRPWEAGARLTAFLAAGRHGDMEWMATHADRRDHPQKLWPEAKSAVLLGLSYAPPGEPLDALRQRAHAAIASYAARRDYHDVVKGRLKQLAGWIAAETGEAVKVFVDTAPLMEKPLAQAAGLGWQGKHTNLVSRAHGSWLLLGAILTAAALAPDAPEGDHCGACRACLDICPTDAFPAPYQLDARRCIAYLTIEHKGAIAPEFRETIGNRVFGCDDCLAVCPWNKFAKASADAKLAYREDLQDMPLAALARLDEAGFRAVFRATPIARTGRERFVRNVAIAAGNSGDPALIPTTEALARDPAPLVRAMGVWALRRLDPARFARLKPEALQRETDPAVRREWGEEETL